MRAELASLGHRILMGQLVTCNLTNTVKRMPHFHITLDASHLSHTIRLVPYHCVQRICYMAIEKDQRDALNTDVLNVPDYSCYIWCSLWQLTRSQGI
jgi:hypothetical protein